MLGAHHGSAARHSVRGNGRRRGGDRRRDLRATRAASATRSSRWRVVATHRRRHRHGLTTWMQGRAARMNPVAVFIGVLFFGWLWGGWGLLLGVPILAVLKSIADRVEAMHPISELLGRLRPATRPQETRRRLQFRASFLAERGEQLGVAQEPFQERDRRPAVQSDERQPRARILSVWSGSAEQDARPRPRDEDSRDSTPSARRARSRRRTTAATARRTRRRRAAIDARAGSNRDDPMIDRAASSIAFGVRRTGCRSGRRPATHTAPRPIRPRGGRASRRARGADRLRQDGRPIPFRRLRRPAARVTFARRRATRRSFDAVIARARPWRWGMCPGSRTTGIRRQG